MQEGSLRVSKEMTAKSIRDEIVWLFYASSVLLLGYSILAAYSSEDNYSVTHLGRLITHTD